MNNVQIRKFVRSIASDNLIDATDVFKSIVEARKQKRIQGIVRKSFDKSGKSLGTLMKMK